MRESRAKCVRADSDRLVLASVGSAQWRLLYDHEAYTNNAE